VLWKTLGMWCNRAGLGDVVLPTRAGISIRKRCVSSTTDHQAILLQRLSLEIPNCLDFADM